jgi:hypothetical protein
MTELKITQNFKDWACSFSGCDGGNPESEIWLCGIEWGYGKKKDQTQEEYEKKLDNYYTKELREEIVEGARPDKQYLLTATHHLTYQFGQKVAKLCAVIEGCNLSEKKYYEFLNKEHPNAEIFKLNLYPVAFPNESDELWEKYQLPEITGLASKPIYRTWCFLNRFPFMSKQVETYKPRLIIATGISHLTDFVVCFAGQSGVDDIHKKTITSESDSGHNKRDLYWARINERTKLFVIPFLGGQYGLNSDDLIQKIGEEIRKIRDLKND